MNRNALIVVVLLALALVPVTCTFLFSGGEEDEPAETPEYAGAAPEPEKPGRTAAGGSAAKPAKSGPAPRAKVPTFMSFENRRYQQYDALIAKYVADFNAHPEKWAGATPEQAAKMKPLTVEQVKAHMIQETGGGDVRSRAAWAKDPLQVNVPGDWNPYKKLLGLREPRKRNEGSLEKNLKAGIMLLARKGYGVAGQPASNNRSGAFDGWKTALQRYNGRSDKAANGRPYREAYAERILKRAQKGEKSEVEIPIPTKRK